MTGRSSRRGLVTVIATLGLALVIIVGAAVLDVLPGTDTTVSMNPVTALPPAPSGTETTPGAEANSGADTNEESPEDADQAPGSGENATEVLPAPDETSPLGLPPSTPLPALVTLPLPRTASETGALVAGYPADLIPLSPGATVTSSSVASAENQLQVTLAASTPMASAAVLDFYRTAFAANNLVDTVAPAAEGSSALLFSRGTDTILLTVTPTESGNSTYSVFGAFTAAK